MQLSWLTTNTSHVEIDGIGRLAPTGTATILAAESGEFVITLINPYTEVRLTGPRLDVIDPPPPIVITAPWRAVGGPPATIRRLRIPVWARDDALGRHRGDRAVTTPVPWFAGPSAPRVDTGARRVRRPRRPTFIPPGRPTAP